MALDTPFILQSRDPSLVDSTARVYEVLDLCVGSWEYKSHLSVVRPSNKKWRSSMLTVNFENLAVTLRGLSIQSPDDESIANICVHLRLLSSGIHRID
jgi:hypothetical protein